MSLEDSGAVTDPQSRHNLHVTRHTDLINIGPWSRDQLYSAVQLADAENEAVVLDYGREQLYLAAPDKIHYLSPTAFGLADAPGLRVDQPRLYDPDSERIRRSRVQSVTVSPEFDILIPAFDWTEPDTQWEPPGLDYREQPIGTPSGVIGK